jgi:hypothetical protein
MAEKTKRASSESQRRAQFKAGQSGNPGGRPLGARNKLQTKFFYALSDDFERHGVNAIKRMREEDPSSYVRTVASLMPKEFEVKRPLEELTDDELLAAVGALRSYLEGHSEIPIPDGAIPPRTNETLQ